MTDIDDSQTGLNYELLVEEALLSVVRSSLRIVENVGLLGDTHFYISFITKSEGVEIDENLRTKHPDQMTIVIQHQYADLQVFDKHFNITLFFGGKPHPMIIPFRAITSFNDPSVGFGLQFSNLEEHEEASDDNISDNPTNTKDTKNNKTENKINSIISKNKTLSDDKTGEVVSLDTFRKKPSN